MLPTPSVTIPLEGPLLDDDDAGNDADTTLKSASSSHRLMAWFEDLPEGLRR